MFFRIHTADLAWATQRPRGLFVAVGKLVEAKTMTEEEIAEYWRQRGWFEANLSVPPFYADGNSIKAITWYKDNEAGRRMFERMSFYLAMTEKYRVKLYRTTADSTPGTVVYEDEWQIGVVDSRHDGPEFATEPL